ncbi:hypothetical protein LCGC14_3008520 [marine sediment metagenome]|uniref:Uncharacterized protein n=1 Tax=marine sediment metagenome TaxID=412755 RepID=A0A0F8Z6J4_9ZZZZ
MENIEATNRDQEAFGDDYFGVKKEKEKDLPLLLPSSLLFATTTHHSLEALPLFGLALNIFATSLRNTNFFCTLNHSFSPRYMIKEYYSKAHI